MGMRADKLEKTKEEFEIRYKRCNSMGKHAILVVKNKKNEYLQYYDERWNSYLFLNCKMQNKEDEEAILNNLETSFDIKKEEIQLFFVNQKVHKKFSESAKKEKEYEHYFYKVELLKPIDEMKQKEFRMNNKKYRWFSFDELLKDTRIQKVNSDIVGYIKEFKL